MKVNNYISIITMLCSLVGGLQRTFCQSEEVKVPSAGVANYSSYAMVEPSLYTGAMSIPIPLATINDGPLSLTMGLSYHSDIRAHTLSSEVGLGWSISGLGAITREVRGLPDDMLNKGFWNQSIDPSTVTDIDKFANREVDSSPDLFTYNFSGGAGKFVVDKDEVVHQIVKTDIVIELVKIYPTKWTCVYEFDNCYEETDYNAPTYHFIITTPDGTRYTFGGISPNYEKITYDNLEEITVYHLNKVQSHDGLHEIKIAYKSQNYQYYSLQDCSSSNDQCDMSIKKIGVNSGVPENIVGTNGSIEFSYIADREDLIEQGTNKALRLSSLRYKTGGKTIHYDLVQNYFIDNRPSGGLPSSFVSQLTNQESQRIIRRLRLDKIVKRSGVQSIDPYFKMEYTSGFFPNQITKSIDHWGYYNGESNNYNNIIPTSTAPNGGNPNVKRESQQGAMQHGLISSLTNSMGGKTSYTFEANQYFQEITAPYLDNLSVNNGDCSSSYWNQTVSSANVLIDKNKYDNGELIISIKANCTQTAFGYLDIYEGVNKVYSYNISAYNLETIDQRIRLNTLPLKIGTIYKFEIKSHGGLVSISTHSTVTGINKIVGGMRLSNTYTYIPGSESIQKSFKYINREEATKSSGRLFRRPQYSYTGLCKDRFSTQSLANTRSFEGYHIGYDMAKTEHNGNGYQWTEYYNDLSIAGAVLSLPIAPEQPRLHLGALKKQQIYRQDNVLLQESQSIVDNSGLDSDIGMSAYVWEKVYVNNIINWCRTKKRYSINAGRYRPKQMITTKEGITLIEDIEYVYNLELMPQTITTREGNNIISTSNTSYTNSYTGWRNEGYNDYLTVKASFINKKIKIPYYKNIKKNNATVYDEEYLNFDIIGNQPRIKSKSRYYINSSINSVAAQETDSYLSYNSDGFVTSYRAFGANVSTTTQYNTYKQVSKICVGNLCSDYDYLGNSGLVTSKTSPDGRSMSYIYDDLIRLSQTKDECTQAITNYSYQENSSSTFSPAYIQEQHNVLADPNGQSAYTQSTIYKYLDGLGRVIETVSVGTGPGGKDQITAVGYDSQGRKIKSYEPKLSIYSSGSYQAPQSNWKARTTEYEPSPLNRVAKTTMTDWIRSKTYSYGTNTATELINPITNSYYAQNTLWKSSVTDEDGIISTVYTDNEGKKRADKQDVNITHYVYDNRDLLVKVIPPGSSNSNTALNYSYNYTVKDQLTSKTLPNKGTTNYIYAANNLLEYEQNQYLIGNSRYIRYEYDSYHRPIKSGIVSSNNPASVYLQVYTEKSYGSVGTSAGKETSAKVWKMDNSGWLTSSTTYDNCGRASIVNSNNHLVTGASDRVEMRYDPSENVYYRESVISHSTGTTSTTRQINRSYHDKDNRQIYNTLQLNDKSAREISRVSYNEKEELIQKRIGGTIQTLDYSYLTNGWMDAMNGGVATNGDKFGYKMYYQSAPSDGVLSSTSRYNGNIQAIFTQHEGEVLQRAYYSYDNHNRLISTRTRNHNNVVNGSDANYSYDVRGNLTSLSRKSDGSLIDNLTYTLSNNKTTRITESSTAKGYKGTSNYIYDVSGNVISDNQKGISNIVYNFMDLPELIQWTDGRKIELIYDATGNLLTRKIFATNGTQTKRYDYIGNIDYLNGEVESVHHGEGRIRLVERGNTSNASSNIVYAPYINYQSYITHYGNQNIYANIVESRATVATGADWSYWGVDCIELNQGFTVDLGAEFLADFAKANDTWAWEWKITDHLGNTRVLLDDNANVLTKTDYYPYGMISRQDVTSNNYNYRYGYNGIEHISDNALDWEMTTYRSLRADIGIWGQGDPKAEGMYGMSPYSAMGGNPISQIDPEGDFPFLALGIGALVGVFSNGLSNISNGQGFFQGAVKAGIWGAVGAGASFGIGSVFGATGSFGHELLRAGVHGLSSGIQSELQGGSFLQGALSGGISSGIGSGIDALGGDAGHQIFGGAVGGGIGAAISGGDFFQGFGQGVAVGTFNHALHSGFDPIKPTFNEKTGKFILEGFPDAEQIGKSKGVGKRIVWKLKDGKILEWTSKNGVVEMYNKTGKKWLGKYNSTTGKLLDSTSKIGRIASFVGKGITIISNKLSFLFSPVFYTGPGSGFDNYSSFYTQLHH